MTSGLTYTEWYRHERFTILIKSGGVAGAVQSSRWWRRAVAIGVTVAGVGLIAVSSNSIGGTPQFAGVLTYHNDNMRTGQNLAETILTPGNVNVSQFGLLFKENVDGQLYAQPLYVPSVTIPGQGTHNIVIVATENDSVYAFDADVGGPALWTTSFLSSHVIPIPSADTLSSDLEPKVGITGTPVIDSSTNTLYVVAATKNTFDGSYAQRLHALDIATGLDLQGSPVELAASAPGTGPESSGGMVTFSALRNNQRAGLLLDNGIIYITFSSHGDQGTYTGWVLGYDASTLQQVSAWSDEPNGSQGGIWMSGAGISTDTSGDLFLSTGNGDFDGSVDWGDSLLRLHPSGSTFTVPDSFTPSDQATLSDEDEDLGSSGMLLLPDQATLPTHLALTEGKAGTIYLVDRDDMGGYQQGSGGSDAVVQEISGQVNALFSMPAYFNNNVYFVGTEDVPKQFGLTNGRLSATPIATASPQFAYNGASLSVSANGNSNGIVWAIGNFDDTGAICPSGECSAVLFAFDAGNIGTELYDSQQNAARDAAGTFNKFCVPTIANGKVYVGTQSDLAVYGQLSALSPTPTPTSTPTPAAMVTVINAVSGVARPGQSRGAGTFKLSNLGNAAASITTVEVSFTNPSLFKSAKLIAAHGGESRSAVALGPGSATTFTFSKPFALPGGKAATFKLAVTPVKGAVSPSAQAVTAISGSIMIGGLPANLGQLSPR